MHGDRPDPRGAEARDAENDSTLELVRLAQKMVGSLIWLSTRTRPDLSFAVSRMSSWSTRDPEVALRIGKRILRYLAGTVDIGLCVRTSLEHLVMFGDASFEAAGSQTGVLAMFGGALVCWRSSKQLKVAGSTAESEAAALMSAMQAGEGVQAILVSMGVDCPTIPIKCDNNAAITIGSGNGTWKSRAILNRLHYVRQGVESGLVHLSYVATSEQLADVLTKFVPKPVLQAQMKLLGMCRLREMTGDEVPRCVDGGAKLAAVRTPTHSRWVHRLMLEDKEAQWLREREEVRTLGPLSALGQITECPEEEQEASPQRAS